MSQKALAVMSYREKLKDPRWQKKRLLVMQRDFFACRDCNSSHNELQVHHCFYENENPWETDDQFLITLCKGCHERRHEKEKTIKRAVGYALAGMSLDELNEAAHIAEGTEGNISEDLLAAIAISVARKNFMEAQT